MVLADGRIAEQGTHEELLAKRECMRLCTAVKRKQPTRGLMHRSQEEVLISEVSQVGKLRPEGKCH